MKLFGYAIGGVGVALSGREFDEWQLYAMMVCFALADVILNTRSERG